MGTYLNPDNNDFTTLKQSPICVDKSLLIKYTNSILNIKERFLCVARPRRFGKSTDAQMLVAYYSNGCDSSSLFNDLKIAEDEDYQKHLNSHNVIFINMLKFYKRTNNVNSLLQLLTHKIMKEIKDVFPEVDFWDENDLSFSLEDIYSQTKNKFIFIIDEWDCLLRNKNSTEENKVKFINFLDILLKDQPYVELVYMTGILPIKKFDDQSTFNMFNEITMLSSIPLGEYMGFTVDEVKDLCKQYHMDYNEIQSWYDGYHLENNISIYSPRSIVQAISNKSCKSYWVDTSNFEDLKLYINTNFNGLKDDIVSLLAGKKVNINPKTFRNDAAILNSKDDVLTLLVHFGYLGFDYEDNKVYIPNKEVVDSFVNAISELPWNEARIIKESKDLLEATWNMNEEKVAQYIEEAHQDTSIIAYNDENALACVINTAYVPAANNYYTISREMPTGKGYADLIFIPAPRSHKPAIVIELKWNQTPEIAINQIQDRKYYASLKHYKDNLLLVGISYNKDPNSKDYKKHYCKITKYKENP
ncbi:MAG: ATP-binding protein [Erysipelotrichaceae bacterium]|nr:ATP-binding protein [Erysipelotrichaceae bacterium]